MLNILCAWHECLFPPAHPFYPHKPHRFLPSHFYSLRLFLPMNREDNELPEWVKLVDMLKAGHSKNKVEIESALM